MRQTAGRVARTPSWQIQIWGAEVLGLFVYVLLGAGTEAGVRAVAKRMGAPLGPDAYLLIGLAHGIALFTATVFTHNVSGAHVNPAVTVGLASAGRFPWRAVPAQVAGQLLGAILGAAAIPIVLCRTRALQGEVGAAVIAPQVSLVQGLAIEALGTAVLMLTVLAVTQEDRAPPGWAALATGMSVAPVTMAFASTTSALVNPARAFGPELLLRILGGHADWTVFVVIDVVGPLLGALAACWVYRVFAHFPRQSGA
ncbi:MAG: MIP/aquaporin family protein [Ktedonobacterales bacterium]